MTTQTTFRFLDLARELRDRIYDAVLSSDTLTQPPKSPQEAGERWSEESRLGRFRGIKHSTAPITYTCSGLLQSNRQIPRELQEAIEWNGGVEYHLDIMVGEASLWPTWLALPAPVKYARKMTVDFRNCSRTYGIMWVGDGGPGRVVQNLLRLLGQFVASGPRFLGSRNGVPGASMPELRLEVLELHLVRMPDDAKPVVDEDFGHVYPDPEEEAEFRLQQRLSSLAGSGLLFGKVGVVRLRWEDGGKEWWVEDRDEVDKVATGRLWAPYGWVPGEELR